MIGKIQPGMVYQVLSQQVGWYQINFNCQVGWVSGAFVVRR